MRIDIYLTANSYVESRQKAQRLIKNGCVTVDGKKILRPSDEIDEKTQYKVEITLPESEKYVSRGGLKLEKALEAFDLNVEGKICVDIGASTGGFTDCLLQHGAKKVFAFDSGKDQLHPTVANDTRVVSKEGFNARYITSEDIDESAYIAVMDVSFISQTIIIPPLVNLLKDNGILVSLVKPQFEAGRSALGKNGIVKKREDRLSAILRVVNSACDCGMSFVGVIPSPIKGGDGNEEYLACFRKKSRGSALNEKRPDMEDIKRSV